MDTLSGFSEKFERCLMNEPPFCGAACPFHIDILSFVQKLRSGLFNTAFRIYRDTVGFPRIASAICSRPCMAVCPRAQVDSAIKLNELERAVIREAEDTRPPDYNIPQRTERVAIIGAGLSGLGCALRLASKNIHTEIFERGDGIPFHESFSENISRSEYLLDIGEQFMYLKYTLHSGCFIESRAELSGFDAVYVASGAGGLEFGLCSGSYADDNYCLKDGKTAWFAGGALIGGEGVFALADGLMMGNTIDAFLKTGNLKRPENSFNSCMKLAPLRLDSAKRLLRESETASEPPGEAKENEGSAFLKVEAERCLLCRCDACRVHCDLCAFYDKWPYRISGEVYATTLPGSAEVKATPAKRLIATCSQCGVCRQVCPEEIDLGSMILAGRQSMHRQEKAPWAFYDFWLRDMLHADGRGRLGFAGAGGDSEYVFFPGCQLGASDPGLVLRSFEGLSRAFPSMGILLRCCGAPAEWAGNESMHGEAVNAIREDWKQLGRPTLLAACPNCMKKLAAYLPEISVISVYELLADLPEHIMTEISLGMREQGFAVVGHGAECGAQLPPAVFDPCAAAGFQATREGVRALASCLGITPTRLPVQDKIARCCGFGGEPGIANPAYSEYVTNARASESEAAYIVYCVNCRDACISAGKPTLHILEMLFPEDDSSFSRNLRLPGATMRRKNREWLREELLRKSVEESPGGEPELIGCAESAPEPGYSFKLIIPKELATKMDASRILEEEVYETLDEIRSSGRQVLNPDTGIMSGYKQIGHMTYWVSYSEAAGNELTLRSVYMHRMAIELEQLWKGVKL
jgi:Fe-S oxidoreductase